MSALRALRKYGSEDNLFGSFPPIDNASGDVPPAGTTHSSNDAVQHDGEAEQMHGDWAVATTSPTLANALTPSVQETDAFEPFASTCTSSEIDDDAYESAIPERQPEDSWDSLASPGCEAKEEFWGEQDYCGSSQAKEEFWGEQDYCGSSQAKEEFWGEQDYCGSSQASVDSYSSLFDGPDDAGDCDAGDRDVEGGDVNTEQGDATPQCGPVTDIGHVPEMNIGDNQLNSLRRGDSFHQSIESASDTVSNFSTDSAGILCFPTTAAEPPFQLTYEDYDYYHFPNSQESDYGQLVKGAGSQHCRDDDESQGSPKSFTSESPQHEW